MSIKIVVIVRYIFPVIARSDPWEQRSNLGLLKKQTATVNRDCFVARRKAAGLLAMTCRCSLLKRKPQDSYE